MKTFKQLEADILSNLNFDSYTYTTNISFETLNNFLKQMYLFGRIEGIKFGNGFYDLSNTKPQEEITRLEGLFKYISTNSLD